MSAGEPSPATPGFRPEFEFVAGSVFGQRAWKLTGEGALQSVAQPAIWTHGTNEAFCYPSPFSGDDEPTGLPDNQEHFAAHQCGFYAYYAGRPNGFLPGALSVRAMGVIEGFGNAVLGSKGFRCTRARVVALHLPDIGLVEDGARRLLAYIDLPAAGVDPEVGRLRALALERYARAQDRYADIPFYDSVEEMHAAHPLTTTPDDAA